MPPTSRFKFERELVAAGLTRIAGVDEAGRGPLAGPVVAAAVVLPLAWINGELPRPLRGLNDSKQLTEAQREDYFAFLTTCADVCRGVGMADHETIDRVNILQATYCAMIEALARLVPDPQHVLVDGRRVPPIRQPQTALVKGDSRSYSIAAASVLAKVTRDRHMREIDRAFPVYGFAEHKGYGTDRHLRALAEHGPCPVHRRSFAPLRAPERELFNYESLAANQGSLRDAGRA